MKLNLPVSQHEHSYPEDLTLVSTTDSKGRLTHWKLSGVLTTRIVGAPGMRLTHMKLTSTASAHKRQLARGNSQ